MAAMTLAHTHVMPWWMGWFLLNPLRRLIQDPERVVLSHVKEGDWVLEIGPGMGYFTLPLARAVGPAGRVVAVDIQPRMLAVLRRRADRAGLGDRIVCRQSTAQSLALRDQRRPFDFVLAFAVVHEIPDRRGFFREAAAVMRPGSRMLIADPASRFPAPEFSAAVAVAAEHGLVRTADPAIARCRAALLQKHLP